MGRTGTAELSVSSPASDVFGLLTDIDRLPEWNSIIVKVVERPETLSPGAEWVVQLKALGNSWESRSTVEEFDPARFVFSYRSQTDDGNPSYTRWRWTVEAAAGGQSRVTVSWDLHPQTFWRRALLVRIRGRQLQREVPASIDSLARALREASV
jgi:uncharacterized protein YndB with AHSA1/START domain